MDWSMFDTDIRDTAKRNGIYSSSSSYDTLTFTFYQDSSKMFTNNTSYVTGFTYAVNKMRHHDTIEVVFRSDLGYGAAGSGTSIPEYSPLYFKIYIQEDADNDDDQ